ncbi:MAG: CCA tRNA nucleotidyltransferase [Cyanobacteria bacterium SIG31]|nr:CCA tRNA nucleotidyltransferase [Cyanobacteria bacterium SIG31]
MNIKDDFILSQINKGYLVGGSVRDAFMGKSFVDRDIAIKGAEDFAHKLAEQFNATFIVLDPEYKIYRLVLEDKINYLDISEIQGVNIEDDLERRDFAMNAIAINLSNGEIIDPFEGKKDIENKIIRHIKDSNFEEDPLRILRAFRFASTTGFELSSNTKLCIEKYKHLLFTPAKERINYELMKLFGGVKCSKTLLVMDEFGILEELFPYVKEMKKVPPNTHHHLDLFHHVVETVRNIEELYLNATKEEKEHLDSVDFGGFPRINHLKLAGFLHDIGKFSTWTIEESGRHRFIKHDDVGAKMAIPFLKDLKFSKKQIEYISSMIKNHIYPSNVIDAPDLSEKVMMRYLRKMGVNVIDNIYIAKADRLSAQGEAITEEIIKSNLDGLNALLKFYLDKKDSLKPLPKLLDGIEIMKIKNIKQSPELGKIINTLKEAQINGEIVTKEDAIAFVKEL